MWMYHSAGLRQQAGVDVKLTAPNFRAKEQAAPTVDASTTLVRHALLPRLERNPAQACRVAPDPMGRKAARSSMRGCVQRSSASTQRAS